MELHQSLCLDAIFHNYCANTTHREVYTTLSEDMNVLFVFHGKGYAGGSSISNRDLVIELKQRGVNVIACIPYTHNNELYKDLCAAGVKCIQSYIPLQVWARQNVVGVKRLKRLVKIVLSVLMYFPVEAELAYLLKKHKIALLHIGGAVVCAGALAAKVQRIPVVWHLREFVEEDHDMRWICRKYAFYLFSTAKALLAVSDAVAEAYRSKTKKNLQLHTIYNGVYSISNQPLGHSILQSEEVHVMFAGGLVETKGVFILIEAFSRVSQSTQQKIVLDIYGRSTTSELQRYCDLVDKLDMKEKVAYHGYCSDLTKAWDVADVVVVCSVSEAFGRVTAEAMVHGCLVVGTASGGTVEIIQDSLGVLVDNWDAQSIALALDDIIQNKEKYSQFAQNGRLSALERFSIERMTDQVCAVYGSLH